MRPLALAGLLGTMVTPPLACAEGRVAWIAIDGAIGPPTAGYISRATVVAGEQQAICLIVQLDTPGGLLDSTKDIVQAFYASPVPVVVYVAPSGAQAGSAGVFITLAADVAAMAPASSIGAAHPVALGGGTGGEEKTDDTITKKLENFAVSMIEAIAEKRGRNVEWARTAVRESAAITAEKALAENVIDLIATDRDALLAALDGRTVRETTLATAGAEIVEIPMLARERAFQLIWRPEVMFILMLVAIYGIIGELSNPGAIFPGVVGAIALILALYMAAILPVNIAGLALIALAVGLFIADALAATHGVLTTGGIVAFFLGALLLFDSTAPVFRLSLAMIVPATVITAAFFIFVVGAGLRAQLLPVKVGRETFVGRTAITLTPIDGEGGRVLLDGEDWRAESPSPIPSQATVEIVSVRGLCLTVKPHTPKERS